MFPESARTAAQIAFLKTLCYSSNLLIPAKNTTMVQESKPGDRYIRKKSCAYKSELSLEHSRIMEVDCCSFVSCFSITTSYLSFFTKRSVNDLMIPLCTDVSSLQDMTWITKRSTMNINVKSEVGIRNVQDRY